MHAVIGASVSEPYTLVCSIAIFHDILLLYTRHIGAGTGPAGPAMAGPFSAEVET